MSQQSRDSHRKRSGFHDAAFHQQQTVADSLCLNHDVALKFLSLLGSFELRSSVVSVLPSVIAGTAP